MPTEKVGCGLDFFWYEADEAIDGLSEETLGQETDLYATYQYSEDLGFKVGWSHFFTDDGVNESLTAANGLRTLSGLVGDNLKDDDVDYLYWEATVSF